MSRLYSHENNGLGEYQHTMHRDSFVTTRDKLQLQGSRKRKPAIMGERGILKPRSKDKGIFNKLSKFFNQYLLTGYENNTNIDDLENSLPSALKGFDSGAIRKFKYDEPHYEEAPLPEMYRTKPHKRAYDKPYIHPEDNFGPKRYIRDKESELVRKLNDELKSRTHDVKRLVDEVDDTNYNLKRAVKEVQVAKESQELMREQMEILRKRNDLLSEENKELGSKLQQINQENVRVSRDYDKLNKEFEQLSNLNTISSDEITSLKNKVTDLQTDLLSFRLENNNKSYEIKLSHLYTEYVKFNLIDNPNLHLKYYDQIHFKLQEFEAYLGDSNMPNQQVFEQFDYANISQLKSILDKLYLDLTKKFIRNTTKEPSKKIIHFLSLNYHLRSKCLSLLCSIERIMIILTYA